MMTIDARNLNLLDVRAIVFDSDTLRRGSEFVYEGARFVCHSRTELIPTVYVVLGNFYAGLYAMRDAAEYLHHDLDRAVENGNLYHAKQGDVPADIEEAKKYLAESRYHLYEAAKKFEAAQQAIASIGHNDDGRSA